MKRCITEARLRRYVDMATRGFDTWDPALKTEFLTAGRDAGREILRQLGWDGNMRINRAGPAVCGDVWLSSEHIYADLSPSCTGPWWYFRGCTSLGDCGAGLEYPNQRETMNSLLTLLEDDGDLIRRIRAHGEMVRLRKEARAA